MKINELYIKTLTDIAKTNNAACQNYVIVNGFAYFINPYKFDEILSLLKLLYAFNDYLKENQNPNITEWAKSKKLIIHELLEEICYYKAKISNKIGNSVINRFFIFENLPIQKLNFQSYLCYVLKDVFKNSVIYDFLCRNNDKFNQYIGDILEFLEQNPAGIYANYDFFTECLLEIDKYKMQNIFDSIDKLQIKCECERNFEKNIIIKNINNQNFECLKKGLKLHFTITQSQNLSDEFELVKYLQILEFINVKRLEKISYSATSNSNVLIKEKSILKTIQKSNFSFIDISQVIFLNLNEENLTRIHQNELFSKIFFNSISIKAKKEINFAKALYL